MTQETVISLARECLTLALMLSAPALLAGLLVGVLVAIFQAVSSVQEQTLSLVPKLVAVVGALLLALPWMLTTMIDFTRRMFMDIGTLGSH